MPPQKRKAPYKTWYERDAARTAARKRIRRENALPRSDPFTFFSDSISGRILRHLEAVQDVGRCELVSRRWRDIVVGWGVRECTELLGEHPRGVRRQEHVLGPVVNELSEDEEDDILGAEDEWVEGKREGEDESDVEVKPERQDKGKAVDRAAIEGRDEDMMDVDDVNVKIRAESPDQSEGGSEAGNIRDLGGVDEDRRKWRIIKKAAARWVLRQKLVFGDASSGRAFDGVNWIVSAGDYIAWSDGQDVCYQRLGFEANGSRYEVRRFHTHGWSNERPELWVSPYGYVLIRGYKDREGALATVCIQIDTGRRMWERTGPAAPAEWAQRTRNIFAVTEHTIYEIDSHDNRLHMLDLRSGGIIGEAQLPNDMLTRLHHRCSAVRKTPSGQDVIVAFAPVNRAVARRGQIMWTPARRPTDANQCEVQGLQTINPLTGDMTEHFPDVVVWGGFGRIFPSWEKENEFAVVSLWYDEENRDNYVWWKMDFFQINDRSRISRLRTELFACDSTHYDEVVGNNPSTVDPYMCLLFSANAADQYLPSIVEFEAAPADINMPEPIQRVAAHLRVDRIWCDDRTMNISLPMRHRRVQERLEFDIGYRPGRAEMRQLGKKTLAVFYAPGFDGDERGDTYLFDFRFRAPFLGANAYPGEL
ncbi:uncharacterized protein DSM5745_00084 [Aspergillus mulundensis]|uniref:F-box domain-containing protein n=1 Tax=Aspergillus mulundensis TaxID=1810919 RepID=A0A3D8T2H1_9EURO|nr:hypothetical protein DSM5745_00084 [Aspergillus mulundensis]RDW92762.1 hypothetical protein DSM5745_00084 [Aspergillus mulundensis]